MNMVKLSLFMAICVATALIFSCSSGDDSNGGGGGTSSSSGDGIVIGLQTWMAKNLDLATDENGNEIGKCYDNDPANCAKYGRLYDWATAMALPSNCNSTSCASQISTKHRGICPSGWHIPSNAEWDALASFIESDKGCSSCDAKHLKATSGWNEGGNGLNSYGFAALPGGNGYSGGSFYYVGNYGYWWSASEYNSFYAYIRYMIYYLEIVYWDGSVKYGLHSVRCLQD